MRLSAAAARNDPFWSPDLNPTSYSPRIALMMREKSSSSHRNASLMFWTLSGRKIVEESRIALHTKRKHEKTHTRWTRKSDARRQAQAEMRREHGTKCRHHRCVHGCVMSDACCALTPCTSYAVSSARRSPLSPPSPASPCEE
jgi:hypothetical protein